MDGRPNFSRFNKIHFNTTSICFVLHYVSLFYFSPLSSWMQDLQIIFSLMGLSSWSDPQITHRSLFLWSVTWPCSKWISRGSLSWRPISSRSSRGSTILPNSSTFLVQHFPVIGAQLPSVCLKASSLATFFSPAPPLNAGTGRAETKRVSWFFAERPGLRIDRNCKTFT